MIVELRGVSVSLPFRTMVRVRDIYLRGERGMKIRSMNMVWEALRVV